MRLLSKLVRAMREKAGITQADLARKCDVSYASVSRWESGGYHLTEQSIEAVAKGLGLTVEQFLVDGIGEVSKQERNDPND